MPQQNIMANMPEQIYKRKIDMKSKTQEEFKKDWVGVCEIKSGEKVARFTSVETFRDGTVKTFDGDKKSLDFQIAELPKLAQRVIKPGMKDAKKFRVRLNSDQDEVKMVTPASGMFSAKLAYIGPAREGQDPQPFEKFFHKGESNETSHLEFFASYEITEGVFKGAELPAYFLHYKFEGISDGEEDEGMTRFNTVDTPQASQLHRLQDWANVHGEILDEPIVFPDDGNILPTLEERALDADREVNVIIEKGYIKSVQAKENYEEVEVESESEELDDVDKAFPQDDSVAVVEKVVPAVAKKVAKKAKKVVEEEEPDDL